MNSVYLQAVTNEAYLVSREVRDIALCRVYIENTIDETIKAVEHDCERLKVKVKFTIKSDKYVRAVIYRDDIHLEAYLCATTYLSKFDERGHLMHYFLGKMLGYGNHAVDEFTKMVQEENRKVPDKYYLVTVTFENKETGQRRVKKYVTHKQDRFDYYTSVKYQAVQSITNRDEHIVSIENLQGLTRERLCSMLTVDEMSEHFHEFSNFKEYFI